MDKPMTVGRSKHAYKGKAVVAKEELKVIENIADHMSPDELRFLLFQGHENEHIARQFLNPDIGNNVAPQGHQNEERFSQIHPQVMDIKESCIYCQQTIRNGFQFTIRSCGHCFHIDCFNNQTDQVKDQHMQGKKCHFCKLERR